jgi:hypothetical protein
MGWYIPGPNTGKTQDILAKHDAIPLDDAQQVEDAFDAGWGVVCVVDSGPFEAAAFCHSKAELQEFSFSSKPKTWLAMDRELAEMLSGFDKQ